MKNKYSLTFLIFLMGFLLTACGIKSQETLTADQNFKGERVMHITFDQENLSNIDDIEEFKTFVESNIEQPLTYSLYDELTEEQGGPYLNYQITLPFNSIEDYINKSKALYEKGNIKDDIEVYYNKNVDLFNYNIEYYDNIKIENLLRYITNRARQEGYLNITNVNSTWEETIFSAEIAGEKLINNANLSPYKYNETINIAPKNYLMTTSKNDDKYTRVFSLIFEKEDYDRLSDDWEEKLFKSKELRRLDNKYIEDNQEYFTIVSYAVIDANLDVIRRVTEDLFGSDVQINIDSKFGTSEFIEKFNVFEKINNNLYAPSADIFSIYYIDSKNIENHEIDLIKNIDINYEKALYARKEVFSNEGFNDFVERQIVFDEVEINTKINSFDNITREIIFNKKSEIEKEKVDISLVNYLKRKNINYTNDDEKLTIKYFGDDFYLINDILFENQPNISRENETFFRYLIHFKDETKFNDIQFSTIKYNIDKSDFIKIENKSINLEGQNIYSDITLSANRVINSTIIFLIIASILIFLVGILIYFSKGDDSIKNIFKKKENSDENK